MRPVYQVADRLKIGCKRTLATLQWTLLSVLSGVIIGLVGTAFYFGIVWVTGLRQSHPYFLLLLPFGSMLILFIYHLADRDHPGGTDLVLSSIREGSYIPLRMTPLIFISTIFSHLCGASVGREGAALQLGGSIGNTMARIFHLEESERRILVLSGMAAAFSALMGTPLAGAVFAMEITSVGVMYYPALLPTVVSAFTAHYVALLMGQPIPHYDFNLIPDFTIAPVLKISIVGVAAGFAAILFILALRYTKKYIASPLGNRYLRAFILGSVLLILTAITTYVEGDSQSYNGAGMDMIHLAIEGRSPWYAFLMKILFTALSIAAAYKGGEIVPSFFIGATVGSALAPILSLDPALCAAAGMAAVFCGVTNCPLTAMLIIFELFGFDAMPFIIIPVAISYVVSGYFSLYKTQHFHFAKFKGDDNHMVGGV